MNKLIFILVLVCACGKHSESTQKNALIINDDGSVQGHVKTGTAKVLSPDGSGDSVELDVYEPIKK